MTPNPEQVHVHHRVAAGVDRKEVKAEIAVEQQHRKKRGEDRKSRDDQQVRGERRPAEDWHAHVAHAGRPHLENRGDEIDSGQQRTDPRDLQGPEVVIDTDAGREFQPAERRISDPAGLCELADRQRHVRQKDACCSEPQTDRVQCRKGHVADAELQRHREVHKSDHERHRYEEDHDGAVCREDLVEMLRRQISLRASGGDRLLRPHHDGVGEAAHQHEQSQHQIHDADALVIDGCEPLAPQIGPSSPQRDPQQNGPDQQGHESRRAHDDRLVERDRTPAELAEEIHLSALCGVG